MSGRWGPGSGRSQVRFGESSVSSSFREAQLSLAANGSGGIYTTDPATGRPKPRPGPPGALRRTCLDVHVVLALNGTVWSFGWRGARDASPESCGHGTVTGTGRNTEREGAGQEVDWRNRSGAKLLIKSMGEGRLIIISYIYCTLFHQ